MPNVQARKDTRFGLCSFSDSGSKAISKDAARAKDSEYSEGGAFFCCMKRDAEEQPWLAAHKMDDVAIRSKLAMFDGIDLQDCGKLCSFKEVMGMLWNPSVYADLLDCKGGIAAGMQDSCSISIEAFKRSSNVDGHIPLMAAGWPGMRACLEGWVKPRSVVGAIDELPETTHNSAALDAMLQVNDQDNFKLAAKGAARHASRDETKRVSKEVSEHVTSARAELAVQEEDQRSVEEGVQLAKKTTKQNLAKQNRFRFGLGRDACYGGIMCNAEDRLDKMSCEVGMLLIPQSLRNQHDFSIQVAPDEGISKAIEILEDSGDGFPAGPCVQLGPEDVHFSIPVTLLLPACSSATKVLRIQGCDWHYMDKEHVRFQNGYAVVTLDHFCTILAVVENTSMMRMMARVVIRPETKECRVVCSHRHCAECIAVCTHTMQELLADGYVDEPTEGACYFEARLSDEVKLRMIGDVTMGEEVVLSLSRASHNSANLGIAGSLQLLLKDEILRTWDLANARPRPRTQSSYPGSTSSQADELKLMISCKRNRFSENKPPEIKSFTDFLVQELREDPRYVVCPCVQQQQSHIAHVLYKNPRCDIVNLHEVESDIDAIIEREANERGMATAGPGLFGTVKVEIVPASRATPGQGTDLTTVTVTMVSGQTLKVSIDRHATIAALKQRISSDTGLPAGGQQLLLDSRELFDEVELCAILPAAGDDRLSLALVVCDLCDGP